MQACQTSQTMQTAAAVPLAQLDGWPKQARAQHVTKIAQGAFQVRPLAGALGAEIHGLDLSVPLSPEVVQALKVAWYEYLVLVFPGAAIDLAQHVRFSRYFGELELHPLETFRHADQPEVIEVTNRQIAGKPSETAEIGRVWHSDGAYTDRPPTGSLLHCRQIPSAGGNTWFNNMVLAYETLSPGMQRLVDGLEVINDLFTPGTGTVFVQQRDAAQAERDRRATPTVVQPMVRLHPETRRKALYLNPAVTRCIVDMTPEESQPLLNYLFQHSVKPEFVYCHRWRVHDLVMWDNRCAMHLAPADYDKSEIRQMYRTTLRGDPHGRHL